MSTNHIKLYIDIAASRIAAKSDKDIYQYVTDLCAISKDIEELSGLEIALYQAYTKDSKEKKFCIALVRTKIIGLENDSFAMRTSSNASSFIDIALLAKDNVFLSEMVERQEWVVWVPGNGTCMFDACGLFLTSRGEWVDGAALSDKPLSGEKLRAVVAEYIPFYLRMADGKNGDTKENKLTQELMGYINDTKATSVGLDPSPGKDTQADILAGYLRKTGTGITNFDTRCIERKDQTIEEFHAPYISAMRGNAYGDNFIIQLIADMFLANINMLIRPGPNHVEKYNILPDPAIIAEAQKTYRTAVPIRHINLFLDAGEQHYYARFGWSSRKRILYSMLDFRFADNFCNSPILDWEKDRWLTVSKVIEHTTSYLTDVADAFREQAAMGETKKKEIEKSKQKYLTLEELAALARGENTSHSGNRYDNDDNNNNNNNNNRNNTNNNNNNNNYNSQSQQPARQPGTQDPQVGHSTAPGPAHLSDAQTQQQQPKRKEPTHPTHRPDSSKQTRTVPPNRRQPIVNPGRATQPIRHEHQQRFAQAPPANIAVTPQDYKAAVFDRVLSKVIPTVTGAVPALYGMSVYTREQLGFRSPKVLNALSRLAEKGYLVDNDKVITHTPSFGLNGQLSDTSEAVMVADLGKKKTKWRKFFFDIGVKAAQLSIESQLNSVEHFYSILPQKGGAEIGEESAKKAAVEVLSMLHSSSLTDYFNEILSPDQSFSAFPDPDAMMPSKDDIYPPKAIRAVETALEILDGISTIQAHTESVDTWSGLAGWIVCSVVSILSPYIRTGAGITPQSVLRLIGESGDRLGCYLLGKWCVPTQGLTGAPAIHIPQSDILPATVLFKFLIPLCSSFMIGTEGCHPIAKPSFDTIDKALGVCVGVPLPPFIVSSRPVLELARKTNHFSLTTSAAVIGKPSWLDTYKNLNKMCLSAINAVLDGTSPFDIASSDSYARYSRCVFTEPWTVPANCVSRTSSNLQVLPSQKIQDIMPKNMGDAVFRSMSTNLANAVYKETPPPDFVTAVAITVASRAASGLSATSVASSLDKIHLASKGLMGAGEVVRAKASIARADKTFYPGPSPPPNIWGRDRPGAAQDIAVNGLLNSIAEAANSPQVRKETLVHGRKMGHKNQPPVIFSVRLASGLNMAGQQVRFVWYRNSVALKEEDATLERPTAEWRDSSQSASDSLFATFDCYQRSMSKLNAVIREGSDLYISSHSSITLNPPFTQRDSASYRCDLVGPEGTVLCSSDTAYVQVTMSCARCNKVVTSPQDDECFYEIVWTGEKIPGSQKLRARDLYYMDDRQEANMWRDLCYEEDVQQPGQNRKRTMLPLSTAISVVNYINMVSSDHPTPPPARGHRAVGENAHLPDLFSYVASNRNPSKSNVHSYRAALDAMKLAIAVSSKMRDGLSGDPKLFGYTTGDMVDVLSGPPATAADVKTIIHGLIRECSTLGLPFTRVAEVMWDSGTVGAIIKERFEDCDFNHTKLLSWILEYSFDDTKQQREEQCVKAMGMLANFVAVNEPIYEALKDTLCTTPGLPRTPARDSIDQMGLEKLIAQTRNMTCNHKDRESLRDDIKKLAAADVMMDLECIDDNREIDATFRGYASTYPSFGESINSFDPVRSMAGRWRGCHDPEVREPDPMTFFGMSGMTKYDGTSMLDALSDISQALLSVRTTQEAANNMGSAFRSGSTRVGVDIDYEDIQKNIKRIITKMCNDCSYNTASIARSVEFVKRYNYMILFGTIVTRSRVTWNNVKDIFM